MSVGLAVNRIYHLTQCGFVALEQPLRSNKYKTSHPTESHRNNHQNVYD